MLQSLEDSGVDPSTFDFNNASGNVELSEESKVDNAKTKVQIKQADQLSEPKADLETTPIQEAVVRFN